MSYYIIRNYTIEYLFGIDQEYSDYNSFNPKILESKRYEAVICFLLPPVEGNYEDKIIAMSAIIDTLNLILSKPYNPLILFTMPYYDKSFHNFSDFRLMNLINEYNRICLDFIADNKSTFCFDFASFIRQFPVNQIVNWKHFFMSQIVINPRFVGDFQNWFKHQIDATLSKRHKCIVLDLDNTLWGGVIGEDGIEGIFLGGSYPGNVYEDMQRKLLSAYNNGIILAICSKNNEEDAMQVINKHPNMILRDNHFAIKRINWMNKADNIQDIANTLNIGLDSIVFIDDNPSERELIKNLLPTVVVPDFPEKLYLIPQFIDDVLVEYFTLYSLTEEDKNKTQQYRQNAQRNAYKDKFNNYNQYLKALKMVIDISLINEIDIPRVAQLTQKTNQFNLTTKRYSEEDIRKFIEEGNIIIVARIKDKFGEYGLTGVCIIVTYEDRATIDTFLMSCRVIGREIENEFIKQIILYLASLGYNHITSSYIKTGKNALVESFFDNNGFIIKEQSSDYKKYDLFMDNRIIKSNNIVEVRWHNEG